MESGDLNTAIVARGKELFAAIADEKPSLFDKGGWIGKVMDWSMHHEQFKISLFRFVDVFPSLTTSELLTSHIRDYFGTETDLPPVLAGGARLAGNLGHLGGAVLNRILAANIHELARQFIIAETASEAVTNLTRLRREGFAAVVDLLGEATLSEAEAEHHVKAYGELLSAMDRARQSWSPLGSSGGDPQLDWGHAPQLSISVKPTALYCLADPVDFEGSVTAVLERMRRLCRQVVAVNGFLCIDMETRRHKGITIEVFKRLRREFRDYAHLGVVLQAYLRESEEDLDHLLAWARREELPLSIRLVKGAYWDYETVRARQNGWPVPVWTRRAETDAAFERLAATILAQHQLCHLACGSHNIRTIAAVLETARHLHVPEERYEFQLLYGMAEPVRRAIMGVVGRVRLYSPYGQLVPGMGYLVRRLLENTANESFLRQSFAEGLRVEQLLEDPARVAAREPGSPPSTPTGAAPQGVLPPFRNEPAVDFSQASEREAFTRAISQVRTRLGRIYPLYINGAEVQTPHRLMTYNPNNPSEEIGVTCQAGIPEVDAALAAARKAFPVWRDLPPESRAEYLVKAAAAARSRRLELAAWQVLAIGKQWEQATADVAEAVDFLEYYAREMLRLAVPRRLGQIPGEENLLFYEPRGVAAVIAPWNFPLAISMGMVSAALVTGNCVVYKPSGLTSIIGWHLVELFRAAGLPAGVFNFTPGESGVMGDYLVDSPDVALIAFTGSRDVGLRIIQRGATVHPGQEQVKKIVCEMGGKNAIIIDADADLDEAVPQVLASAFGFQGQKCSACSRVIVLDEIYDRFVTRLLALASAVKIGPSEDPGCFMGAVAEKRARENILAAIELGRQEGEIIHESGVPAGGWYVPLTIVGNIRPDHRLAREEIFGPVLAVMRVKSFDEALSWANAGSFALTGGLFSRSPSHIQRAGRDFRVGNLYINRSITGAMVGRQPFGGGKLSGAGTKAGGPDYLVNFMEARVITENTMRRGFAPVGENEEDYRGGREES